MAKVERRHVKKVLIALLPFVFIYLLIVGTNMNHFQKRKDAADLAEHKFPSVVKREIIHNK